MCRMSKEGQLRRMCAMPQRQVTSNMQTATMRETNRKKGKFKFKKREGLI